MRRNLDRLYSGNEVTYKSVVLIAIAVCAIMLSAYQYLADLDIHLRLPAIGNLDAIALIGLAISLISGVFAFQQIRLADVGMRDARQHAIKDEILREIEESKILTDRASERSRIASDALAEKIAHLERELYSVRLQLEKHADLDLHVGAQRRLSFIEDKVYEIGAAVKLLGKSDEVSYRLARLEQEVKKSREAST